MSGPVVCAVDDSSGSRDAAATALAISSRAELPLLSCTSHRTSRDYPAAVHNVSTGSGSRCRSGLSCSSGRRMVQPALGARSPALPWVTRLSSSQPSPPQPPPRW
jgi:hypothetical protein